MANNDLQSNIVMGADVAGVESGMARAKRAVEDVGSTVERTGRRAEEGLSGIGRGGDNAARTVERATRSLEQQIQRQIVSMQAGSRESREYWEAIANQRGVNSQTLRPLLDQLDAVRAKTEDAKSSAQGMATVWEGVGRAAGAAAAVIAGAFSFRKVITETIQAEQEQAQLAAALRSTGEAAGWSADQLNKMADRLASRSTFSAGEITQAQTRLLSYTNIVGNQFPRAMQTVIDMSARMGMSVTQSAETIGRALDVPSEGLTALQRQGFRFTEEQKKLVEQLEKTGKVGEAQAIILQSVESSYAGAAAAARDTFGGALTALQNTIDDLLTGESSGMKGMRQSVEGLITVLGSEETRTAFQSFISLATDAVTVFAKVAGNFAAFRTATNREAMLAGVDEFGLMTKNAETASARVQRLAEQAERFQEAIGRGSNVEFNTARLEKTRDLLTEARRQAEGAADALKRFANQNDNGKQLGASDFGLTLPAAALVGGKPAADVDKKAETAYKNLIDSIKEKIALEKLELESGEKLTESQRLRVKIEQDLSGARRANALQLVDQLSTVEKSRKTAQAEAKEAGEATKAYADLITARQNSVATIQTQIQREQDVAAAVGLARSEVTLLEVAKLEESATSKDRLAVLADELDLSGALAKTYRDEAKALRDLAAAKRVTSGKQEAAETAKAAGDAAKKASEEWRRYTEDINKSLTDALLRGFESGKGIAENFRDTLKNMFNTLVLRPVISATLSPVSEAIGALTGVRTAANGAGTLNTLANNSGLLGAAVQAYGGYAVGASTASLVGANAVGMLGGDALGALIAANGSWAGVSVGAVAAEAAAGAAAGASAGAAAGSAAAAGGAAGGSSAAGAAAGMGPYGWIAAAVILAIAAFAGKGEKRYGGHYGINFEGDGVLDYRRGGYIDSKAGEVTYVVGPSGGEFAKEYVTELMTGTTKGINTLLSDLGSGLSLTGFQAGLETSGKGRGGVFSGGTLTGGITFGESGQGGGRPWESTSSRSPNAEEAVKNFATDMLQVTIQALQAATDLPKSIAAQLKGVDAEKLTDEAATELLTTISQQIEFVKELRKAIDLLPFPNLRDLSFDAADGLLAAAGGLEALNTSMAGYLSNYFSEEEQRKVAIDQTSAAFKALGLAMPDVTQSADAARAQFRALVESIDINSEKGAQQYAGLLGLQGAFANLTPIIDTTAQAAQAAASELQERLTLESQLLQLQGNTAELRKRSLNALLSDESRAIQQAIYDLQDKQTAEAAAQAAANAAEQVKAAWQSVGDTLAEEIKRLLGVVTGDSAAGLASAQSQFAIATAQARAGDQDAASSLPELSRSLEDLYRTQASSSTDLRIFQAQIAASLAETAQGIAASQGINVESFAASALAGGASSGGAGLVALPPAQIYSAGQAAGALSDAQGIREELRQLRQELRQANEAIAGFQLRGARAAEKTAGVVDQWDVDGMPAVRQGVGA
ncbi:phage tail length tape measure family protein [Pseudorhodoferax sp. Leaf274]|uniref:phage tail length tape measure family protein n=1 Tax=Pseudorhodoferax sp. Leaf274 TaxID=1736318 RepID=UPI000703BD16|nr:phage tail length tape measure family protein [Pseudorhodoferax sp. Leaf274]KQP43907.1 hypothetical protein ASF44_28685 [Pseudorhodoferax sp. Leaf274]